MALATVTSAPARKPITDQSRVADVLVDVEYLLDNVDDLGDEDGPMVKEILDMDVDGLGSDEEVSEGQFSWLAGIRTVKSQPVLDTTKCLKKDFGQEV